MTKAQSDLTSFSMWTPSRNPADNYTTIWGRKSSFNVQKVLWFASELGLTYQHIQAGGSFGGLDSPEFLAMNPHGKVPVINDFGNIVWESHSILRYLAASYGDGKFWPADPGKRATIERWMDWSQTALQPDFLSGVFWGYYRTPEADRDWKAITKSMENCKKHFTLLDTILKSHPYIVGREFTLADVTVGVALFRYYELDLPRPELPHLDAWYKRLQERAGYKEHVMLDFSEMRGRLTF
jgi:glutathione S-transferase